ncbi:DUF4097 and DUF4098 domain-containing protein YvlB [Thermoanaerobacter thermohydrosulfuricus]|uniref:Uncharacterized protein n=2 Tax=Thermoanaerobacter thermohydrosulfuricus TaxID=1516 RepID=M8CML8_THETY|nr:MULTISPECIES: DUF4097 family beta strand repeat-containing protein [Thermoanaerobacter]EMT38360.1 hypothetical protein TthWC1_2134 [Thermoanaerobacter thermohydrosulfuricus WC1]SDF96852.1 DUF4097 and DUF4098 domain-containing protein YvlB [Thermoanaerobacter thermohydrosulfuricus]SFE20774.1 DUF4097 and DUF4098 domain-containing protein YvlB [Thermoanaerobacter thermohydrosulfuricus]
MNEEKELILKMLEEGKITAEEAAQLLEAIEGEEFFYEEELEEVEEKEKANKKEESFSKLEEIPFKIEEKIDKAISTVREKEREISTFERTVDRLLDTFLGISLGKTIEKEFRCDSVAENTNIRIEGRNGEIYIETWEEEYASITTRYVVPRNGEEEIIYNCQNGILEVKKTPKIKALSVKMYLPKVKYKNITLSTTNGRISIEGIEGESLQAYTTNGSIYLEEIKSYQIENHTTNAKIEVDDATCERVVCRTSNGSIAVEDSTFNDADLNTINGKIIVEDFKVNSSNSSLKASTTNGSIEMEIADEKVGVSFDLSTVNGKCQVKLPSMFYEVRGTTHLKGKTQDYERAYNKINIVARTVNGNVHLE